MDTGKEITNIQPTLRNPQTDVNTLSLPLDQNRLNAMFEDFVKLIDASPNTIRTYSISLRQWFKYLRENQITQPSMDTVFEYRDALRAAGKKETTVQNYIIAVKQFFKWTEARHLYPNIAK